MCVDGLLFFSLFPSGRSEIYTTTGNCLCLRSRVALTVVLLTLKLPVTQRRMHSAGEPGGVGHRWRKKCKVRQNGNNNNGEKSAEWRLAAVANCCEMFALKLALVSPASKSWSRFSRIIAAWCISDRIYIRVPRYLYFLRRMHAVRQRDT